MGVCVVVIGVLLVCLKLLCDDVWGVEMMSKGKKLKVKVLCGVLDVDVKVEEGIVVDGYVDFGFERVEALTGRRKVVEVKKKKFFGGFELMDILLDVFWVVKCKGYCVLMLI